MHAPFA
jgi:peptidyl-tRNA hydrolase